MLLLEEGVIVCRNLAIFAGNGLGDLIQAPNGGDVIEADGGNIFWCDEILQK